MGPLALVSGQGQLTGQSHQWLLHTFVLLDLSNPLLLVVVIQDALAGLLHAVACVFCALLLQVLLDMVAHRLTGVEVGEDVQQRGAGTLSPQGAPPPGSLPGHRRHPLPG